MVSPCCGAPVRVASSGPSDRTTNWYECTKCGKPCDPNTEVIFTPVPDNEALVHALDDLRAESQRVRDLEAKVEQLGYELAALAKTNQVNFDPAHRTCPYCEREIGP